MQLTDSLKTLLVETAKTLKGSERRRFMARTVKQLGLGGQRLAAAELGWNRDTIRKGLRELESGFTCEDAFNLRGRKRIEDRLPHLLEDIKAIMDSYSQTEASLKKSRSRARLSAAEVRRRLIEQKQYTEADLPTTETIRVRLNQLGYYSARVVGLQAKQKSSKISHFCPPSDRTASS